MATTTLTTLASVLLQQYGKTITQAFTLAGPGNTMVPQQSIMGRLIARNRVQIGGDGGPNSAMEEWGVYTTAPTAASFGQSDPYPASTPMPSVSASLPWKRVGIPMEVDNLLRLIDPTSFRGGASAISSEFETKIKAVISAIETQLASDGTGNGGLDITGCRAFLSAANVYAGINQAIAAYWQATVVPAGGGALSRTLLQAATSALFAKGALGPQSEMWMSATQWYKYTNLYLAQLRASGQASGGMGGAGDYVPPVYTDGLAEIPIYVLPSVPAAEVWVVNPDDLTLRFLDHTPQDAVPMSADRSVNREGVPIGIEEVYLGRDSKAIMIKAYGNLAAHNPRVHAALTGLAV